MIYLDNAATTFPKPECVYQRVDEYNRKYAVNAGRGAYRASREASELIRRVREELLRLCGARNAAHVIFSPSATIALNQIINGCVWESGDYAYVTPYEHNSVLRPLRLQEKRKGIRVIEIPLQDDLSIDIDSLKRLFAVKPPKMVCVTAISNVTGYVLPAAEIFKEAGKYGAFRLLDASQALGFLDLSLRETGADAIVFAGHKTMYSTFGIAGFYLRYGAELEQFLAGGNGIRSLDQDMPAYAPEAYEAGSMDTPAVAGLYEALQWRKTVDIRAVEAGLMEKLISGLSEIPEVRIYISISF